MQSGSKHLSGLKRAIVDGVVGEVKTKYSKSGLPLDPAIAAVLLVAPASPAVIDIDVLLRSASDLPLVIRRLADWGYEYRGDLGVIGR